MLEKVYRLMFHICQDLLTCSGCLIETLKLPKLWKLSHLCFSCCHFKVYLIFHQIKCTQWSEVVVYRVRSEKFREVLSSLFLFFPPLCAAYQNSIQNFTSFIRKEHLSSENRFKIPYFLCRLYQATLPQFWTSITLLQWKNKGSFFTQRW